MQSKLCKQQLTATISDFNHLAHIIVLWQIENLCVTVHFLLWFILNLRVIFKYKPVGAYIWRDDLMEGFLFYEFGGLKFGGACRWRGLISEFYSKIWSCVQISPSNNAWLPYVCQMCIFPVFDYAGSISFRTVSSLRKNTILCKKETRVRWFSKTEIFTNRVWLLRLIFSNQILETTNCWLIGFLLVSTLKAEASFSLCELSYEK